MEGAAWLRRHRENDLRFFLSRHIEQFVQIYDRGSIRAAAERVSLTQPALSKSLKQLEEHLGVVLFERRRDGVVPTPFAHVLRKRARIVQSELEYASWELSSLAGFETGHLRIGVGPVWSQLYFPSLLPALCREFPELTLAVETGPDRIFREKLESGEIDLYFGAGPDKVDRELLEFSPVRQFNLTFYAREGHPILRHNDTTGSQVIEHGWIGFTHQDTVVDLLRAYMARQSLSCPRFAVEVESVATLCSIAQATNRLIVATDNLAEEFNRFGILPVQLAESPGAFLTGVLCRKSVTYLKPIDYLIQQCRKHFGDGT